MIIRILLIGVLLAVAVFVLLHAVPWLLGALALYGALKLFGSDRDRWPPPPTWP